MWLCAELELNATTLLCATTFLAATVTQVDNYTHPLGVWCSAQASPFPEMMILASLGNLIFKNTKFEICLWEIKQPQVL